MNLYEVDFYSAAPFAISITVASFLALFQIVIARRIGNAMMDETATKTARWIRT
jgi:hypothetical protein